MGQEVSRSEFEWVYTEEPHATRRKEMLAKYPEIKSLMGPSNKLIQAVVCLVMIQLVSIFIVKDLSWPVLLIAAYCVGGVINHALTLAIHESVHNLAFGHSYPAWNRYFAMFANLPLGFAACVTFKKYHLLHHRYQGDEKLDMDLPGRFEGIFFHNTITKFFWVILQPLFYLIRPLIYLPLPVTRYEVLNWAVELTFDFLVYYFAGIKPVVYLIGGTLLAFGLHPVAGHFISEHYVFHKGFETYSYYGPLNYLTFNVGYHNEHHDFPYVSFVNLPKISKIAPEYYKDLPYHTSWCRVIYDFITDPSIGPYNRVKRVPRSMTDDLNLNLEKVASGLKQDTKEK